MMLNSLWTPFGALAILVLYQQLRIYQIRKDSKNREELFQIVTENAADMIALVDVKGRRLYNSPAYKRILGYSAAELGETSSFEQIHPDDRFRVLEAAREARQTGVGKRLEYRIRHKDGSWRVLESVASTVRDSRGEVAQLVIVNRDVTERKRAEEQLEHNLLHDSLTGLPNRRLFLDRLQQSFARMRRDPNHPHALLLANVDHFKGFNQTLGTVAGDGMLVEIAHRIEANLREEDSIARSGSGSSSPQAMLSRLGGDEFIVLLDGVLDPSDGMRVAERIQAAVGKPFAVGTQETRPTMSIGIALATPEHQQAEDVLHDADAAVRRAKALGGARCELFDEAMHSRAVSRLRLEADLRAAIAGHQFRVYYQPVVRLDTRRITSFEALLRWQHPTQGLISPCRFLEAAEGTGLLVSIGRWVMLQACRQLKELEDGEFSGQPVNMTVNLSARQFADIRLTSEVHNILLQTGIDPSRLQLEIPESVASADPKRTLTLFSHFKHLRIGMILDDFGSRSSLRGLWQLPFDAVKLDRMLVHEMSTDRAAGAVVEVIVSLARKLRLTVIAGGVETGQQARHLRDLGCELGQGYYFSPPLEAQAAQKLLRLQPASTRSSGAAR